MAINYLNTVDLNKNQLNNAAIQNLGTDPATGVLGQVYYNTTDSVLKICVTASTVTPTNAVWAAVGGGVESIDLLNSTYVSLADTGTSAIPELTASLSAVDGSSGASERYLTKSNGWAEISTIPGTYTFDVDGDFGTTQTIVSGDTLTISGDGVKISTAVSATDILTISHELQSQSNSTSTASPAAGATFTVIDSVTVDSTGHIGGKNLKTITLPADTNTQETYTLPVSAGTAVSGHSVADIDLTAAGESTGIKSKVTIAGKDSNIAITETTGNNGIVNIALTPSVTIDNNLTVGGEISQTSTGNENTFASELNMSSLNITNVLDPTSPQDAATKQYVDDATVGGLIYQGGYDADTNTPDLTTSPNSILKGWTYTVTVEGTFFGEQLRVGDVLIAEENDPSALTDWTTVQNNIDLASLTQVGIGNVAAGGAIDVSYSSGTATVSVENSTPTNKGAISVLAGTGISVNYSSGTATVANTDTNATNTKVGTIAIGALSGTVTHTFGVNTIVQTIDSSGNTVYCDISRTATTAVATISATQTTAITILVQKIG